MSAVAAIEPTTGAKLTMPKVRHAMILLCKNRKGGFTKLQVTERGETVLLSLDVDDDGIGVKHVELTLPEAIALADALNRVRRYVANRPEYRP